MARPCQSRVPPPKALHDPRRVPQRHPGFLRTKCLTTKCAAPRIRDLCAPPPPQPPGVGGGRNETVVRHAPNTVHRHVLGYVLFHWHHVVATAWCMKGYQVTCAEGQ